MAAWIAILQFPLVALPLVVIGLAIWGSDFHETTGRLYLALFLGLPILDRVLGARVGRLARGNGAHWLLLAGVLLAGFAYRPLHLGYWDEHSIPQALGFCGLGLSSWAISRLGVDRLAAAGTRSPGPLAGALLLLGVVWWAARLYPLLPTLGLGACFTLLAFCPWPPGEEEGDRDRWSFPPASDFLRWGAFLASLDLFLVVWDYRTDTTWALHLGLAFAAAALGVLLAEGWGRVLLVVGAAGFLWLVVSPSGVLRYEHAVGIGLAIGALLERVLRGSEEEAPGRAPLGGWTGAWVLGMMVGVALYLNLAFAAWRTVFLLPLLWLALRPPRRIRTR